MAYSFQRYKYDYCLAKNALTTAFLSNEKTAYGSAIFQKIW